MTESIENLHQQELVRRRGLLMTQYIAATIDVSVIRKTCLENIVCWRSQGTNSILWDEWVKILIGGTDPKLIDALTDDIEENNRNLRRAGPYAGLINPKIREFIFSRPLTDLPTLEDLINYASSL
jgi:hypothetical protein